MMPNPDPSTAGVQRPSQAFQQLREALKSPSSAQQQQKVLGILKANPPLMAAFKKQRTAKTQQQQKQMLLNEDNMAGNETMKSRQVLPNSDPSIAGMQRPTQAQKQLLETPSAKKNSKKTPSAKKNSKKSPSAQQPQHLVIMKLNPIISAYMKQRTAQKPKQLLQQQLLLNEEDILGIPTVRPGHVLPNPILSVAAMQKSTQVWKQLHETLNAPPSDQQLQQVLVILKANPELMAAFIKQRSTHQQKLLLQQKEPQQMLLNDSNMAGNPSMIQSQVLTNPDHSKKRSTHAWKQLLETFKSPSSAQTQQQVLTILKANPQLTAAFIQHRTTQQQQQTQLLQQQEQKDLLQQQQQQVLLNEGTPNLQTNKEELLLNERNSDVAIEVKRKKFNCHKCILGAPSPVFNAMEHEIKRETSSIMTIEDSKLTTFQEFIIYLYTGSKKHLTWKNVTDRYKLANKYCVGDMEKLCAEYIKTNITTENFYDFFLLSDMHNDRELTDITIKFFLKNSKEITESKEWLVFLPENPIESNELIKALVRK